MKTLRKILIGTALIGALAGCNRERTKEEQSGILHEDAIVSDVVYTPSNHGSGIGPTFDVTGEGGVGIAITSVDIPEKYAVVFKCQHGKFVIEGTNQRYKELWRRFSEGDSVDVSYREIYRARYKDINGDGERDLVEKVLTGYDFIDAQPKQR